MDGRPATPYRPRNGRGGLPRLPGLVQPGPDPLQECDRYLERVRGAARATRIGYLRDVRGFVKHVFGDSDLRWPAIGTGHVASCIVRRAAKLPTTCRRDPSTPIRSFLRYMTGVGLLSAHLEFAIPPTLQWKHTALPAALSPDELGKVLAVPRDRTCLVAIMDRHLSAMVKHDPHELRPINLQAGKIFKIRAGKIHEIEANGFLLPYNAASGWQ